MDLRSRSRSYLHTRIVDVDPGWQQAPRRNRANTVCLIVSETLNNVVRYGLSRRSRSTSSSDQSIGEIQFDAFEPEDSVFEMQSSTTSSSSSGYLQAPRRASSPPSISVVQLSTSLSPASHIAARISPSHHAGRLGYRPLPSLPRYSELSSTYGDGDTSRALDHRVEVRVTPPPPYHSDSSGALRFQQQIASRLPMSKTSMIAFVFAASLQALTGTIIACLALAALGFMPAATVTEPTFFSSGFTVLIAGIHGIIGFFSLKKKPRLMKLCIAADALFALACLILCIISAMEAQQTTDDIMRTYKCVQETASKSCICFSPDRPNAALRTLSSGDRPCSVSDAILMSLIHATIIGNLCSCVPSSVIILIFLRFVMKHSLCSRRQGRVDVDATVVHVTNTQTQPVASPRSTQYDVELPTYDAACQGRRCFSPSQPSLPRYSATFELEAIPETPPSYHTNGSSSCGSYGDSPVH